MPRIDQGARLYSQSSAMPGILAVLCAFCVIVAMRFPADACAAQESGKMIENAALLALSGQVRIKSEKNGKAPFFVFRGEGPWHLYVAADMSSFDFSKPVLSGEEAGAFPVPVKAGQHYFYAVQNGGHIVYFAEELLPVSGGYNFRDLGGIPTTDGRITAWGKLFRSDDLSDMTREDLAYLESIPLHTVVDFRTEEGAKRAPDVFPATVKRYVRLPLSPGNIDPRDPEIAEQELVWEEYMQELNRDLVQNPENIKVYRHFMARVQEEERLPLLFHCAAGKDRTGLATAYILFALGVSKEEVLKNYMASAFYLQGKYDRQIASDPSRQALFTVKPEYLTAAIDAMEKKSGSVEKYLTRVLGVDLKKMRSLFLQ